MKNHLFIFLLILLSANCVYSQWEPDVRLSNDTAFTSKGYKGSLAADSENLHVVWLDKRDGNFEIYYKRSTNGGISWSSDTRLTNADDTSSQPCITVSGLNVHLVWTDKRDGNYEIYYKHSTDGGLTWGDDIRLTNDPAYSSFSVVSVTGSLIMVVWNDQRDGYYEVYYKRSTDGGNSWSNDIKLSNDPAVSFLPSIAVSGSDIYIVWYDFRNGNSEIYYKHSSDGGDNWGSDIRLTNNVAESGFPSIIVSGLVLHLVWYDSRNGNNEIYYKQSTDKGMTWSADTRLSNATGNSIYPSIACSGSLVHVAWQDNRNANEEIFYKYSNDGGLNWSVDTLLVNNSATISLAPSLAISGSVVHVVWKDKRDGPNGEIYYKRNPTGNLATGIVDLKRKEIRLTIFPNPASDYCTIYFSNNELSDISISIFNSLGIEIKKISKKELSGLNNVRLSTISFPPGLYNSIIYYGLNKICRSFVVVK